MVTESLCWRFSLCWCFFNVHVFNRSPILNLSSTHFVSNICHQHRCHLLNQLNFGVNTIYISNDELMIVKNGWIIKHFNFIIYESKLWLNKTDGEINFKLIKSENQLIWFFMYCWHLYPCWSHSAKQEITWSRTGSHKKRKNRYSNVWSNSLWVSILQFDLWQGSRDGLGPHSLEFEKVFAYEFYLKIPIKENFTTISSKKKSFERIPVSMKTDFHWRFDFFEK